MRVVHSAPRETIELPASVAAIPSGRSLWVTAQQVGRTTDGAHLLIGESLLVRAHFLFDPRVSLVLDAAVGYIPSSIDMPSDPITVSFPFSVTSILTGDLSGDLSGDEKIPSTSSMPYSSRRFSLSVMPVRLVELASRVNTASKQHQLKTPAQNHTSPLCRHWSSRTRASLQNPEPWRRWTRTEKARASRCRRIQTKYQR